MVQMFRRAMPTSKVENAGELEAAQKQAMALDAVLENSEWLTVEEIGAGGRFSPGNLYFL